MLSTTSRYVLTAVQKTVSVLVERILKILLTSHWLLCGRNYLFLVQKYSAGTKPERPFSELSGTRDAHRCRHTRFRKCHFFGCCFRGIVVKRGFWRLLQCGLLALGFAARMLLRLPWSKPSSVQVMSAMYHVRAPRETGCTLVCGIFACPKADVHWFGWCK